jgi:prepilin-type N-terminal cleavage/methylation domain-containing protein
MPPVPDSRHPTAGFTLLETIVALVILSAVVSAFFELVSTAYRAADRAEAAALAFDHRSNALELATTINPMTSPQGTFDLGPYRIQWVSRLIEPAQQSSAFPTGKGDFVVALYRVTLSFPDDPSITPVVVTQIGYRREKAAPPQPGVANSLTGL